MQAPQDSQIDMFSKRTSKAAHIVVVGAGPCGALTALLLARGGVNVTLIEAVDEPVNSCDDLVLSQTMRNLLARCGVELDETAGWPIDRCDFFHGDHIVRRELEGKNLIRLPRPALVEKLIEKARTYPDFTFMQRVGVGGIAAQNGRAVGVHIKLGQDFDVLRADFVVVAEGRLAHLRQSHLQAMGQTVGEGASFDAICQLQHIVGPCPEDMDKGQIGLLSFAKGFGLFRTDGAGQLNLSLMQYKPPRSQLGVQEPQDWFTQLIKYFPRDLARWLTTHRRDFISADPEFYYLGFAQRWHAPGILFLGDGVHAALPMGAKGIGAALMDAVMAANLIGPHLIDVPNPVQVDLAAGQVQMTRTRQLAALKTRQRKFANARLGRYRPGDGWLGALQAPFIAAKHMTLLLSDRRNQDMRRLIGGPIFGDEDS